MSGCTTPHESCLSCGLWEVRWEHGSTVLIAAHVIQVMKEGLDRVKGVNQAKGSWSKSMFPRDLEVMIKMTQFVGDERHVSQRRAQGSPQCLLLPSGHWDPRECAYCISLSSGPQLSKHPSDHSFWARNHISCITGDMWKTPTWFISKGQGNIHDLHIFLWSYLLLRP